ncbi:hypothetical protein GCM10010170_086480 [Dactylosporangium salmoneum]|uniref:HTH marR-type domain-containing protein n=1 Tax=Dactylosporangium salmoneum TaxID=53361 RepID=A0ABP5UFY4_9ACTN
MLDRGLIERVPTKGRAIRHRLTEKGDTLREEGQRVVEQVLTKSFSALTPAELSTLDALLQRLLP